MQRHKLVSTDTLKLRGTQRADRIRLVPGLDREEGPPTCPSWVGKVGRREWKRLIPVLTRAGLMSHLDRTALGLHCQAFDDYVTLRKEVAKEGFTHTTHNGNVVTHPAAAAMMQAWAKCLKSAAEFGMSPGSRTSVTALKRDKKQDPFDHLGEVS